MCRALIVLAILPLNPLSAQYSANSANPGPSSPITMPSCLAGYSYDTTIGKCTAIAAPVAPAPAPVAGPQPQQARPTGPPAPKVVPVAPKVILPRAPVAVPNTAGNAEAIGGAMSLGLAVIMKIREHRAANSAANGGVPPVETGPSLGPSLSTQDRAEIESMESLFAGYTPGVGSQAQINSMESLFSSSPVNSNPYNSSPVMRSGQGQPNEQVSAMESLFGGDSAPVRAGTQTGPQDDPLFRQFFGGGAAPAASGAAPVPPGLATQNPDVNAAIRSSADQISEEQPGLFQQLMQTPQRIADGLGELVQPAVNAVKTTINNVLSDPAVQFFTSGRSLFTAPLPAAGSSPDTVAEGVAGQASRFGAAPIVGQIVAGPVGFAAGVLSQGSKMVNQLSGTMGYANAQVQWEP